MSGDVKVVVDGRSARVPAGTSVAAALALLGGGWSRISVHGEARAPVCGMGICQECRLLVDGRQRLACQTVCVEGMRVDTGTRR
ncbi:MAG: 2Fe-2S iron-sulfur cluster-binding protein [Pseudomonadota bacterium]